MNHKETNTQKVTKIKHTTHRMDQIDIKLNAASNADGRVRRSKVFLQFMITSKRWKMFELSSHFKGWRILVPLLIVCARDLKPRGALRLI